MNELDGIIDDLEQILRPKDKQGKPMPFGEVGIAMDTSVMIALGATIIGGVAGGIALANMLNK